MKQKLPQNKMAANGNDKPDLLKLFDFPSAQQQQPADSTTNGGHAEDGHDQGQGQVQLSNSNSNNSSSSYESSADLNGITRRQMQEDISAYRYDIDYCRAMLAVPGITTQEIRSLHVRLLDCSHHVRHCQHRIELIDTQMRLGLGLHNGGGGLRGSGSGGPSQHYQQLLHGQQQQRSYGTPAPSALKRKRQRLAETPVPGAGPGADEEEGGAPTTAAATPNATAAEGDSIDVATTNGGGGGGSTSVQRLGFWKCRLCTAQKYLNAGPNRVPSEPGKWPLKDISKMLNHYLDMHTEHAPDERCRELGDALAQNLGPFEYWLTRTRLQEIKDVAVIDDYIETLQAGRLPEALRNLNRAAAAFPNSVSGTKK
ncbi:hypothetical protein SLS62_009682 [Diatrype stigma]|uniref:Uncharacterized protein n=1 Tax=Diatrype stigma TaxID=117547 RepID=A0AAN9YIU5_9PEZI